MTDSTPQNPHTSEDTSRPALTRRAFLAGAAAATGATGAGIAYFQSAASPPAWDDKDPAHLGEEISIVKFSESGESLGLATVRKIEKTDKEWKAQLTPRQYAVVRQKGTERAFTGQYDKFYEEGIYRCVACGTALFASDTKFDSVTGWPSFWAPIAEENVTAESDWSLGMPRTEVLCRRCDGHLGHVFRDGPAPTGLRYCLNSEALVFVRKP